MKPPVISVIFSVYNGAPYLREAVESILNQTYRDFEFIIVDDGSTDATPRILDEFTDNRIVRLRNENNLGLVASLNKALAVAQGEIIARMDADDISLPDRFQKQLAYLEQHPEVGVLGTAMSQVDAQGKFISVLVPPSQHELILWQTLFGCAIFHATVMMRQEVVRAVGGYDVNFLHSEDLELWSRLFQRARFANLSEPLYTRRLHRQSIISTQSIRQQHDGVNIRQKLLQSIVGYPVPTELAAWLLNYDYPLNHRQRFTVVLLQDLYSRIVPQRPDAEEIKENLQAELNYRIRLVDHSKTKYFLRRIILSFSKVLPSTWRHQVKVWWISLFTKHKVETPSATKVVFVMNNFLVGGVEKLLGDIIRRLDKRKFSVSIITIFGAGPLEAQFRELNIPIYFAAGKLPFYEEKPLYKLLWLIISPVVLVRLVWRLWQFHPDVVVTSLYQADILGILAGWIAGVPKRILIHHDVYPIGPVRQWLKRKLGVGLATDLVAVSQTVKDFVVTYFGARADRVRIIHNGIDVGLFRGGSQPSGQVLGMLGRLEPVKDPLVFVHALQILRAKFGLMPPGFMGGEGSLRPELTSFIAQNKLANLKLDGEVRDVPGWLGKIDILVVPSVSEGFGLVVLEGLAAGKIVVASDVPAIRELITDGVNGCLFPAGDERVLADILQKLLTDSNFNQRMREGVVVCQNQQLAEYDISQVANLYADLLLSGSDDHVKAGQIRP